jgi:hypothetical protein
VSDGEKYYTLAGEASPISGHPRLMDAICELADRWIVPVRGLALHPDKFRALAEGSLYAGRAVSLGSNPFDPMVRYVIDVPGGNEYRATRKEKVLEEMLSSKDQPSERQGVDTSLLVADLERRLRHLDRLGSMVDRLDGLKAMIKVLEEELQKGRDDEHQEARKFGPGREVRYRKLRVMPE